MYMIYIYIYIYVYIYIYIYIWRSYIFIYIYAARGNLFTPTAFRVLACYVSSAIACACVWTLLSPNVPFS